MEKSIAIVYISNTGHTARYAKMLGEIIGVDVYSLKKATSLAKGTRIIYFGWLCAYTVKGYKKADKIFDIAAVAGVGLGKTGSQTDAVRTASKVPNDVPVFTLCGGMDYSKLRGINKFMIDMISKVLASKQGRTDDENEMLNLIKAGGDFVNEQNLTDIIKWFRQSRFHS